MPSLKTKRKDYSPRWLDDAWSHSWLPYTQMQDVSKPLAVKSAKNVTLTLEDGRELVDGIASWWSVCHGYQHPHIVGAIKKQADELCHVMFAGLANQPAYTLSKRLIETVPNGLNRVFYSDSGSTSVELAMKMSIQFWKNKNQAERTKIISFKNGYHGDTIGAMSLSDPDGWVHQTFKSVLPKQIVVDVPSSENDFVTFEAALKQHASKAAALVIEPLVQGAGGMEFHEPEALAKIYKLAKKYDLLFIADEVATGFGRTGTMFACEQAEITPDIMCIGKALSAGALPMAATLATEEIYDAFLGDELTLALLHGPTYMGNALACAAANASLDLFEQEDRLSQVKAIEVQLSDELEDLTLHSRVKGVRTKGAIGVVQLHDANWDEMFRLRSFFMEQGVWLRPFADIIYIMPSFTISKSELTALTDAIKKAVSAL